MENKLPVETKKIYLIFALYFCCSFALLCLERWMEARQAYLAQLWDVSTSFITYVSYIPEVLLLVVALCFHARMKRYFQNALDATREEREYHERRKRELAAEDAKAQAWLNSLD
jgi:hypothetical protein